ncbi:hypothetical protein SADUNF_Sadunf03G0097500 [Salix dunnii]|uniref:Uncharacterized protein n=1 Tax=Salix dunnii TaxID=1413687 RepID=A0A835N0Q5_9ROSI|nr:hypothetical protein SADUNF_Sadunf03G0097500 [Salix dunnii]
MFVGICFPFYGGLLGFFAFAPTTKHQLLVLCSKKMKFSCRNLMFVSRNASVPIPESLSCGWPSTNQRASQSRIVQKSFFIGRIWANKR